MMMAHRAEPLLQEVEPTAGSGSLTICVVEDHDEAYHAWKKAGFKNKILVHFDAHIDFAWIAPTPEALLEKPSLSEMMSTLQRTPFWRLSEKTEEERTHLGNYIHQAIRAKIVREFVWVYPDDPDLTNQTRAVRSTLEAIAAAAPGLFQLTQAREAGYFEARIYGRRLLAIPYSAYQAYVPQEEVLLDIDLDFFIIQSLYSRHYPYADVRTPCFWLSPAEFVADLHASGLRYKFVTLAYSVEEGYTPLRLKFLGMELAKRLLRSLSEDEECRFEALRDLFRLSTRKDPESAVRRLEELIEVHPNDAALRFNLAMLLLEGNDIPGAAAQYRKAIEADPTYRTRYNHAGPALLNVGLRRAAQASYERMKQLDPHNPYYRLFELGTLISEKAWARAILLGRELLKDGVDHPVVRGRLAESCLNLRRYHEAWDALGPEPSGSAATTWYQARYLWLKARVAEALNRREDALACYHKLIRHGEHSPGIHRALARLYLRKRNFFKARRHLAKAMRLAILGRVLRWWRPKATWDSKTS